MDTEGPALTPPPGKTPPPRDVPTPLSRGLLTPPIAPPKTQPRLRPAPGPVRPRLALCRLRRSRSSVGEVQWEAEFFALQDSNNKLAGALREANAAAAQWRQQLEAQRAEAERLRQRVRKPHPPEDPRWPKGHCEGPASYLCGFNWLDV